MESAAERRKHEELQRTAQEAERQHQAELRREAERQRRQAEEEHDAESDGLRTGFRRKPDSIPMIADSQ
jgi:hypothetical protein